jgi:hypothetical protein
VFFLFQELCGLKRPPDVVLTRSEAGYSSEIQLEPVGARGFSLPVSMLLEGMYPVLKRRTPEIQAASDLPMDHSKFAFIRGLFQTTRFPDGNLNLEINFFGVKGILFYNQDNFGPFIRPLIVHDRFYDFSGEVEALVYMPGRIQSTIFYHQTYGDNKEHEWSPLVPIAIKSSPDKEDSPQIK